MLQRQERKPKRANSSAPAAATDFATLSRGLNPAPSPGTAAVSAPTAGFDFSTIPIIPPERQMGREGGVLSPATSERIQARRGGGAPLEPTVQRRMEDTLGHTFADVRVHADGESDRLNRSLGASAFTLGSDVFLGQQATSTGTYGGDHLLAHELTHVVQQRGAEERWPLAVGATDGPGEREADGVAGDVASGNSAAPGKQTGGSDGTRIQRAPKNTPPGGTTTTTGVPPGPDPVEVLKRRVAALELDQRWRARFGVSMANYRQAVSRVTQGIDMATTGFQEAQVAQSQTDQLTNQLIGLGASLLFAGAFEWIAGAGLKKLGDESAWISKQVRNTDQAIAEAAAIPTAVAASAVSLPLPSAAALVSLPGQPMSSWVKAGEYLGGHADSIIEKVENPVNTFVSGSVTNIWGAYGQQQDTAQIARDTDQAQRTTEQAVPGGGPGGSAVGYLARKTEALDKLQQDIEQAFLDRSTKLAGLDDATWATFDVGAQERTYQQLLDRLDVASSGVDKMKPVEGVANVIERYMWVSWILNSADRESSGRLWNFGTDIDLRLIKIGVERDAGVLLSEHWWQHSSDDWGYVISAWARGYKGSIVLGEN